MESVKKIDERLIFDVSLDMYLRHKTGECVDFPKKAMYWAIDANMPDIAADDKQTGYRKFYKTFKTLLENGSCANIPVAKYHAES